MRAWVCRPSAATHDCQGTGHECEVRLGPATMFHDVIRDGLGADSLTCLANDKATPRSCVSSPDPTIRASLGCARGRREHIRTL